MKIVKYIDVYTTEEDEEGEAYDKIHKLNIGIPEHINEKKITNISPYFTQDGRLFKNVSIVMYDGNMLKVVGNYNDLNDRMENKTKPVGGFKSIRKNESTKG